MAREPGVFRERDCIGQAVSQAAWPMDRKTSGPRLPLCCATLMVYQYNSLEHPLLTLPWDPQASPAPSSKVQSFEVPGPDTRSQPDRLEGKYCSISGGETVRSPLQIPVVQTVKALSERDETGSTLQSPSLACLHLSEGRVLLIHEMILCGPDLRSPSLREGQHSGGEREDPPVTNFKILHRDS